MNADLAILRATKIVTDDLSDVELAKLYMVAMQDGDPKQSDWYEKCNGLFTIDGGKKMHESVKEALDVIVERRLKV